MTFRRWTGVSLYTSACALAETCVFDKQSPGPFLCGPQELKTFIPSLPRAPLLPKLRGQFAEFLNEGSLDHLRVLTPAYQCRFAVRALASKQRGFSRQVGSAESHWVAPQLPPLLSLSKGGFSSPCTYNQGRTMSNRHAQLTSLYSPRLNENGRCRNINLLSIAYAFRPRLRPD